MTWAWRAKALSSESPKGVTDSPLLLGKGRQNTECSRKSLRRSPLRTLEEPVPGNVRYHIAQHFTSENTISSDKNSKFRNTTRFSRFSSTSQYMFFIYKFEWFNAFVFSTCAWPLWKSSSVSLLSTMSSSILYTHRLFSNVLCIFVILSTKIIFILQCHLWTNSIYNRFFNIVTSIVPFLCFKSLKYLVFFSPYLSFASWKLIFKYSYTGDILCWNVEYGSLAPSNLTAFLRRNLFDVIPSRPFKI